MKKTSHSTAKKDLGGKFYFLPDEDVVKISPIEASTKNIPVTYNRSGEVISYFNDSIWDFSFYVNRNTNAVKSDTKINWLADSNSSLLVKEFKLATLVIFINKYPVSLSIGMVKRVASVLLTDADILVRSGVNTLNNLNGITFHNYLSLIEGKYKSKTLEKRISALNSISKLNLNHCSFVLPIKLNGDRFNDTVSSIVAKYSNNKSVEQYLSIPNSIHSNLLRHSISVITDSELVIDAINKSVVENYNYIVKSKEIVKNSVKESGSFIEEDFKILAQKLRLRENKTGSYFEEKFKLNNIFEKYSIRGSRKTLQFLGLVFSACLIVIASFTGMRTNEILRLKKGCFKRFNKSGKQYFYITSYETKISGGEVVDYITSPMSERAINLLEKIHEPARRLLNEYSESEFLILSQQLDSDYSSIIPTFRGQGAVGRNLKKFVSHFDIRVSDQDLKESVIINGHSDKVTVNCFWELSIHQFRRSLVVNFLSHNVVGIPELKQQLKHMYASMTSYYGNNSDIAFAENLHRDKSLLEEIDEIQVEQNLMLYKRIHYGDENLEGVKGREILNERNNSIVLSDDEIRFMIKSGQWKITRSPFSYCTKGKDCDKTDVNDPSFCGEKCETTIIMKENALAWEKLYIRNQKLLATDFIELVSGVKDTMIMQNRIAKKIMDSFDINY